MAVAQHWLPFLNTDKGKTVKIRKNHATATQKRLSEFKKTQWQSLGTHGLHWIVQKPKDEDLNEWVAMNVVDFFNEISILVEIACLSDQAAEYDAPGKGFPPGVQYKWKEPKTGKALPISGPEYLTLTMENCEMIVNDPKVFPANEGADDDFTYPDDFIEKARTVLFKLFRIFAILFGAFMKTMKEMDIMAQLTTSFKHYVFFCYCHNLMPPEDEIKQVQVLEKRVQEYREQFLKAMKEHPNPPKNFEFNGRTMGTMTTMREISLDTHAEKDL